MPAVVAEGLEKSFGDTHALCGVDFEIERATVLGVLGPNGAGKTTAVRILTTLLRPDAGRAVIDGIDVVRRAAQGAGPHRAHRPVRRGRRAPHRHREPRARRVACSTCAGRGQGPCGRAARAVRPGRRRRPCREGLLRRHASSPRHRDEPHRRSPSVLFLDEPTTGLDPRSRLEHVGRDRAAWSPTAPPLLLTTQYLDEAERLADDIVVIDHGAVIARGTADRAQEPERRRPCRGDRRPGSAISTGSPALLAPFAPVRACRASVDAEARTVTVPVATTEHIVPAVVRVPRRRRRRGARRGGAPAHPRRRVPAAHRPPRRGRRAARRARRRSGDRSSPR